MRRVRAFISLFLCAHLFFFAVFVQGDTSTEWYIVYKGGVDVIVSKTGNAADGEKVVSLGPGASFGDVGALHGTPRTATITSNCVSILLRVRASSYRHVMGVAEDGSALAGSVATLAGMSLGDLTEETHDDDEAGSSSVPEAPPAPPEDLLRLALEKPPSERTPDDLADILDEMNHLKAFSHLSTSVRKELCGVFGFTVYETKGSVLFSQGDEGTCWYVTYRGSVDVQINGVTVCTLQPGEGFGELALINDKPRAATIVTSEDDCSFLKVEKADFNRILKDIENNTLRLEEHGQVVIVLEKKVIANAGSGYVVMSATPAKLVKHLEEDHAAGTIDNCGMVGNCAFS